MDAFNEPATAEKQYCPSCGKTLKGKFCHRCGEKAFKSGDLSLLYLFKEAFSKLTHIDSSFFRTCKMLCIRPGELTSAWRRGNRKPYLKPLQLFLVANLFYFVFLEFFQNDVFFFPADNFIHYKPLGVDYEALLTAAAGNKGISPEALKGMFNDTFRRLAKTWVILNVPLLTILLGLLFYRKQRFWVEHFVMSMHFYAFVLLYICALSIAGIGVYSIAGTAGSSIIEVLALGIFIYLFLALRRFYGERWWLILLKMAPLYFGIILCLNIYRFCLFILTTRMI